MTGFFSRDKGQGLYKPLPIYKAFKKTWLTVSNRVVLGWKGFEVVFRKSQALQETVVKKNPASLEMLAGKT